MRSCIRHGKVNPVAAALVPPVIFLAGLMVYKAVKVVAPSALTIDKTQKVEAMEVIKGISPVTKKGLEIPQAASLRGGGSSRLVIAHPTENGAFLLVSGTISAGFLGDKIELDKMLHLRFSRSQIEVTSGGEPVDAVMLYSRLETNPLIVDDPNTNPEISVLDLLFANQTLKPVPPGYLKDNYYESDNGMRIEFSMSMGRSGTISLGDVPQLNFKLDPESTAWVEMPRTVRVQHKAIGTEDLKIGILIPQDDGTEPFVITMLDEEIATVRRR